MWFKLKQIGVLRWFLFTCSLLHCDQKFHVRAAAMPRKASTTSNHRMRSKMLSSLSKVWLIPWIELRLAYSSVVWVRAVFFNVFFMFFCLSVPSYTTVFSTVLIIQMIFLCWTANAVMVGTCCPYCSCCQCSCHCKRLVIIVIVGFLIIPFLLWKSLAVVENTSKEKALNCLCGTR